MLCAFWCGKCVMCSADDTIGVLCKSDRGPHHRHAMWSAQRCISGAQAPGRRNPGLLPVTRPKRRLLHFQNPVPAREQKGRMGVARCLLVLVHCRALCRPTVLPIRGAMSHCGLFIPDAPTRMVVGARATFLSSIPCPLTVVLPPALNPVLTCDSSQRS